MKLFGGRGGGRTSRGAVFSLLYGSAGASPSRAVFLAASIGIVGDSEEVKFSILPTAFFVLFSTSAGAGLVSSDLARLSASRLLRPGRASPAQTLDRITLTFTILHFG